MDINLKNQILEHLKNAEIGLTTQDLCEHLKLERHTVAKYLESLTAENLVEFKELGRTKLWKINKAPLFSILNSDNQVSETFKELLNNLDEKIFLVSKEKTVLWSNNKVKQTKGKKCFENFNQKEACQNCAADKAFNSGQKEVVFREFENSNVKISTVPIKDLNGQTVAFLELVKEQ